MWVAWPRDHKVRIMFIIFGRKGILVFMVMLLVLVWWLVVFFQMLILFAIWLLRLHIAWRFSNDIFNSVWFVFWLFRFWGHVLLIVPGICPDFYLFCCFLGKRVCPFLPVCRVWTLCYILLFFGLYIYLNLKTISHGLCAWIAW